VVRRIAVATAILLLVLATSAAAVNVQPQPDIYAITWNGSSPTERVDLTNDPAFDGWPSPSPDGRQIAFASTRGGFDAVWVMNSDGSDPRRLTDRLDEDVHDIGPIMWSPNGTRIAFSAILEPPGTDARYWRYLIYVTPSSGGRAQRLDIDGWAPASFSSDSQLLTYAVPSQFGPAIVVASANGSRARMLQPGSTAPAFAPRGRRILFLREPGRVATMDIGGRVQWTLRGYAAIAAEWARDGRVVFLANR
jgi:Tol biopolymer transport system component